MTKEEVIQAAFQIISFAGDAMNEFYGAILDYKHHDIDNAKIKYKEGSEFLNKTHLIQTQLIQAEVNDEEIPYSLIMTHAQDHLTGAINWQRMVNLLLEDE